jgi:hypothetical protein
VLGRVYCQGVDANMESFNSASRNADLNCALPCADPGGGDETAVRLADLTTLVIPAEISPGHFSLIDGRHRLARAARRSTP